MVRSKKGKILVFLILNLGTLCAQKQDYIWHLGKDQSTNPGIQAMEVNFSSGSLPENIQVNTFPVGFHHNNQAICDSKGALLFYTNGCAVMNQKHEIMPHGDTLNHSAFKEITGWDDCDYGYPGIQNIVIIDDPGSEEGYYLLHKTIVFNSEMDGFVRELRFSYVNMNLDNGFGDVVYFDSLLMTENPLGSYLTAIKHSNEKDWWVIQPLLETSEVATYLIDGKGIRRMENQNAHQFFDTWFSGSSGTARFSPDGDRYAYWNRHANLHLYNFDRTEGLLSSHEKIIIYETVQDTFNNKPGSVEWSPNSRFLYLSDEDSLHQVDTWESDIEGNGIKLIDTYNGTLDPFPTTFRIMCLAPDCKIYMCSGNGSDSYHVINNPDEIGSDCNFVQNGIKLPQHAGSSNLPLHPRWRVDEEDKCDPSIVSVFGMEVFYRRDLKVYPNPAYSFTTIKFPSELNTGNLKVFNLLGQMVFQTEIENAMEKMDFNLEELPTGPYYFEYYPNDSQERFIYEAQIIKVD